ncbi:hypothetical protein CHS0354_030607, partial [Potamilus streckersoni]
ETAQPILKDFKTLMKSPSPPLPITPRTKTKNGEEKSQTPQEKVHKFTPLTSRIGWIKMMMAIASFSEEESKVQTEVKQ